MHWSNVILLFENILKIGLAGKAKVTADFGKAAITVLKQAFCLLQLALCDECSNMDTQFLPEQFHDIGTAAVYTRGHVINTQLPVGIAA